VTEWPETALEFESRFATKEECRQYLAGCVGSMAFSAYDATGARLDHEARTISAATKPLKGCDLKVLVPHNS